MCWDRGGEELYQNFLVDRDDKIVVVTLNRPEKRNPINEEMLSEFEQIVMSLRDDASSRAVILTGPATVSAPVPI